MNINGIEFSKFEFYGIVVANAMVDIAIGMLIASYLF
jgi:hypothetical protein